MCALWLCTHRGCAPTVAVHPRGRGSPGLVRFRGGAGTVPSSTSRTSCFSSAGTGREQHAKLSSTQIRYPCRSSTGLPRGGGTNHDSGALQGTGYRPYEGGRAGGQTGDCLDQPHPWACPDGISPQPRVLNVPSFPQGGRGLLGTVGHTGCTPGKWAIPGKARTTQRGAVGCTLRVTVTVT